jgi:integrase
VEPVARCASELLAKRKHSPLPQGLTPHKLRHTFASVLVACGEDPASVMAQLGHSDPKFTLRSTPTLCAASMPNVRRNRHRAQSADPRRLRRVPLQLERGSK